MKYQLIVTSECFKPNRGRLFTDIESAYEQAHRESQLLGIDIDLLETVRNELVDRHNYAQEFLQPIASSHDKSHEILITILSL